MAVDASRPTTPCSSGSLRAINAYAPRCNRRTAKYAIPKINPSSENASGTASETISIAPIALSRTTRIAPSSDAAVFPSHA